MKNMVLLTDGTIGTYSGTITEDYLIGEVVTVTLIGENGEWIEVEGKVEEVLQ